MIWSEEDRTKRRLAIARDDQRLPFQRDRDRLLYSSAFHRLAGITQIVRAGEGDSFHTRQQHTVKVAQVGRRLAEHCIREQPKVSEAVGLSSEVVEAACLAHDMGHPPFGHVGEHTLDGLCRKHGEQGGFEGNAQSFRIVTKLAVRFDEPGLDLTRATLSALLKYPWLRDEGSKKKQKKWSAYASEQEDFLFARSFHAHEEQTAEAALMDWADDIAYSVHDLEDFHRCGVIPWHQIFAKDAEGDLVGKTVSAWYDHPVGAEGEVRTALRHFGELFEVAFKPLIVEPYNGSRDHRKLLRTLTSTLIGRYVPATKLNDDLAAPPLSIEIKYQAEVRLLKQITREYIIANPALVAQQHGQEKIITGLFEAIVEGSTLQRCCPNFLPIGLRHLWPISEGSVARFAADCIASLTEGQCTALHARLYGLAAGSVLDPILR